jgi:1-acyl-sn-glycerol-3-phosphate acyltransferase
MTFIRSLLFMMLLVLITPPVVLCLLLLFWLPAHMRRKLVMIWVVIAQWAIRHVLHIDHRVVGAENIPKVPCVIMSKHQSAWETIALQAIFSWRTSFVYKRELHWLPFFGWGIALMPFVAIDRGAGKEALNQVAERGKARLAEGYSVIIFPEGTRVAPGQKKRYKIGGAYLAVRAGAPVVPVALNSGEFWRRKAFLKRPGMVTISIGPAIDPAGLSADDVAQRAETWIENEMQRISPHLYRHEGQEPAAQATA